jgi:hypothetical protein
MSPAPVATAPATAPAPAPATSPTVAPEPAPAAPVRIVLDGDGLGFAGDASIRRLAFGTDATTVRTGVAASLGEGTASPFPDCGSGVSVVQYGPLAAGFTLVLDGDEFVGWISNSPAQTTANSVRVGMTAADLRASGFADVEFSEGTVGPEWSSAGLAGFLDGTADTSKVTGIHAGQACVFR